MKSEQLKIKREKFNVTYVMRERERKRNSLISNGFRQEHNYEYIFICKNKTLQLYI